MQTTTTQSSDNRFYIKNLIINGEVVSANSNPNKKIPDNTDYYVDFDFDPFKASLNISSHYKNMPVSLSEPYQYRHVKLIRDINISPTEENKNIGLACLLCVTNNREDNIESFMIGPVIERSKKLRSFPGKLSFAGGLFELNDITLEHAVLREFIEELSLDTYLDYDIIQTIKKQMLLQYMIFSHPLIKNTGIDGKSYESRRFNITLVYCVSIPENYLSKFRFDVFQKSEVDNVTCFKGKDILHSLIRNCPFEDNNNGWTTNGAIIVIEQLTRVFKHQYYNLIKDANHDKVLANLLSCFMDYNIRTASELKILLKVLISQLYIMLSESIKTSDNVDKTFLYYPPTNIVSTPDSQTSFKKPPKYNGHLNKLRSYSTFSFGEKQIEYTIEKINRETSPKDIADDIFALFYGSEYFSRSFIFIGYQRKGDDNYYFKERVFNEIWALLKDLIIYNDNKSTKVDSKLTDYLSGGNEYYDEKSEKTGWIITLSISK